LRAAHPDEPWRWREDWAAGRIVGAGERAVLGAWAFALFWCLVSAPIVIFVPRQLHAHPAGVVGLLFPAVGIGLLVRAARRSLEVAKFGTPIFRMPAVPAALGGELRGTIETRFAAPPPAGVDVKLTCIRRTVSGPPRRTVWEHILWRDECVVPVSEIAPSLAGAAIPVRFALPADQPAANGENPDDAIVWRLDAAADVPGVAFEARFEVPVFRTAASPPLGATAAPPAAALELPSHPQTVVRATTRGGREFLFPPHRNPRAAVGLTAFWMIWSGAVWGLTAIKAPLLFLLVFAAVDLLLLAGALTLWFGTAAIVCEQGTVTVRNSVLGIARTRSTPAAQVTGIDAPITLQTGDGSGTPYYSLRLRCRDGRTLDAGFELRDKREMEWLRAELGRAVGLGTSPGGGTG
jgi:hypothetical protein